MATVEFDTAIHIDDEWRRRIAENPLLDSQPQGVSAQMLQADIPAEEAARELQQVSGSPYIAGAQRQRNHLVKHDWYSTTSAGSTACSRRRFLHVTGCRVGIFCATTTPPAARSSSPA